jgi:hypothetical protein
MPSDHYIHPEFGWLAPTPRLKRELRIAFFSLLFGLSLGAVTVNSLRVAYQDGDSTFASPASTQAAVAASATMQSQSTKEHDRPVTSGLGAPAGAPSAPDPGNSAPQVKAAAACDADHAGCANGVLPRHLDEGGPHVTNNRPAGAGVLVDRPQASTAVYPIDQSVARKVEPSPGVASSDVTHDRGQNLAPRLPSTRKERKGPQKTGSVVQPQRPNANESNSRLAADATGNAEGPARSGRADARNRSSRPLGFWDWSR